MLLVSDGRFDDDSVERVWDQANDQIMFRNFSIESFLVGDVEGDRVSILDTFGELFGGLESPTCLGELG